MKKLFILLIIALVGFNSCNSGLKPFTQDLYYENDWSDEDLERIQFYLSDDIILRRGVTEGSTTIDSGKIKTIKGEKIEEVKIKKGTPGVFLFRPKDDLFAVSFDSGDKSYLIFGPSEKNNGEYTLRAAEWDKSKGQGEVTYNGKKYYTPTESAYSILMVNLKKAGSTDIKSKTAKGRTIKN